MMNSKHLFSGLLAALMTVAFFLSCTDPMSPISEPTVSGVTITDNITSVSKGGNHTFSATVVGSNTPSQEVTWSLQALDGNNDVTSPKEGTAIDQTGKLTVASDETAVKLKIRATSVADPTKYGEITVTIVDANEKTVTLGDQTGSPLTYGAGGTATYTITTENIEDGKKITAVTWYAAESGETGTSAPTGVTDNHTDVTVNSDSASLQLTTTIGTPAGTYWFTVTINDKESNRNSLTVGRNSLTSLAITGLNAPTAGVTLDDSITEIANTTGTAVTWYSIPDGNEVDGNAVSGKVYKAGITLIADGNHNFTGLTAENITVDGVNGSYTGEGFTGGKKVSLGEDALTANIELVFPNTSAAALPAPTGVALSNAGVVSWTAVSNATIYTVKLYKAGAEPNLVTTVTNAESGSTSVRTAIQTAGAGDYTVTVTAIGDGTTYSESPESEPSNPSKTFTQRATVQNLWWVDPGVALARWVNTDDTGDYTVQLQKIGSSPGNWVEVSRGTVEDNNPKKATEYDFGPAIVTDGPGSYTFKVKAKGDGELILDSEESAASFSKEITRFDIIAEQWKTLDSVTLSENITLSTGSFVIPAEKTLFIAAGYSLTAGDYLELGPGTWKASGQNVLITPNTISLYNGLGAKFGKDDGTEATVLAGPSQGGKSTVATTYTASGAKVTLGQSGDALTITGASSSAKLAAGATAGFWVKAGLIITTTTLDMSTDSDWCSVIYLDGSNGITLANSDSVLLFNNDNEGTTYSLNYNDSAINTPITIGSSVQVMAIWNDSWYAGGSHNERFASFTGAGNDNTITRTDNNTIWLTKRLKFKDSP
jgi:hypothetical protein